MTKTYECRDFLRRDFLKTTAAAGVAGAVALRSASSYARILGANDRVRVGVVGFADRARGSLIPAFQSHAKELNMELVAVSDIWSLRRAEAEAHFQEAYGQKVVTTRNNEELYDRKDVDAVIIATADFQHAMHCVEAVKAGRDVYVEKPLANKLKDAKAVLSAVEASQQIVQVGTQRRSGTNYMAANDYIRSGKFGDIVAVEMSWNVNQPGRWRRPELVEKLKEQDTDWKRYLMHMPFEKFDPRKHLEYRLFWPYSSGIPCQWMVHQIDTVHWFTGYDHPRSVVANGGIYLWKDGRRNFDTLTAVFDYGPLDDKNKGFQVTYSSRQTNAAGGTKEIYYSNGGTLDLDKNTIDPDGGLTAEHAKPMGMEPNMLAKGKLPEMKVTTAANTGADVLTSAHVRNWMECVRSRKQPNAPIRAGYNHALAVIMVKAAIDTGKRVTFDDRKQTLRLG